MSITYDTSDIDNIKVVTTLKEYNKERKESIISLKQDLKDNKLHTQEQIKKLKDKLKSDIQELKELYLDKHLSIQHHIIKASIDITQDEYDKQNAKSIISLREHMIRHNEYMSKELKERQAIEQAQQDILNITKRVI